ncbi:PorP/SprF family type IX secretion system membrane protein [Maribacter sp. 2308TA10-17]|uniref:PorP/SprF family type IX secretion system membrane protein n=1 Tax=Maribacter sp. 2308TA10-17 TaxID=3386276 RepID=UPI0039BD5862
MFKPAALVVLFLLFFVGHSQEVSLPADMRQHTLNQYNASLFNPAFSIDRNNPQSVSFWTRWQWQNVDADPTTLFLNYSRSINDNSAGALGFFQHNTGIYFNTGGALNYAYQFEFNRLIKLSVGANVFGFVQELADTRFPINPIPGIPQSIPTNDFILQIAPGFNLQVENFSMSLASENLFDYNFTDKESNTATADKIFMGMASYDFPVIVSDSTAFIRPSIYLRTIPEQENQIGLNTLFSTQKYWIQSGYNNFYGISIGAGGTVFNRFSLGALVEFGTSGSLNSKDPSFELIASYFLGRPEQRRPLVASGIIDKNQQVVLLGDELENAQVEELKDQENEDEKLKEGLDLENPTEEVVNNEELKDQEQTDKEETKEDRKEAKRLVAEQRALEKQKRKDSIADVKREKEVLALLKKQEEEQVKKEAEAVKIKEEIAAAELKEQKRLEKIKEDEDAEVLAETERMEKQRKLDSIQEAKKSEAIAAELKLKEEQRLEALKKQKDSEAIAKVQRIEQERRLDSIRETKKTEALAAALKMKEDRRLDSIAKTQKLEEVAVTEAEKVKEIEAEPEVVKPQAGEKYEEVASEDGLEPGFYLIANVFGTKKYFDAFMRDLTNKGMQPKSFYRSLNKYNYAYLERYNTISEARRARDSNYNGKYNGKTWIFRVVGK